MFTPKGSQPMNTPSGSGASPEAVRFAVITAYLRDLNSPSNAAGIPLIQFSVSGLLVALLIGSVGLVARWPNVIFTWMLLSMFLVMIIMWGNFLRQRNKTIGSLEKRYHIDLDGDGKIAGRKPAPREIVSKSVKEDGNYKQTHYEYWGGLPEFVVHQAANIIQKNRYQVNQRSLCGSNRPLVKPGAGGIVGRSSYEVFTGILMDPANGWAKWRDENAHNQGIEMTPLGIEQIDLICDEEKADE